MSRLTCAISPIRAFFISPKVGSGFINPSVAAPFPLQDNILFFKFQSGASGVIFWCEAETKILAVLHFRS
jgi:hypothetical protein